MKNKLSRMLGFTMIELLVVIAVIGVLAVAVLSSINPIEQINKGRDTRLRGNAAQLLSASERFYSIQEIYPWNDATFNGEDADTDPETDDFPDGSVCLVADNGFCVIGGGAPEMSWLDALAETEEVKVAFINQLNNSNGNNVLNLEQPAGEGVTVCFTPASRQFQQEALKACIDRAADLPDSACSQDTYDDTTEYTDEMICLP